MVLELTNENFEQQIGEAKPTVVDFWAPWCGPCKMLGPILEEVSKELSESANFAKINVDNHQEIAVKFGIMGIPCLIIFKEGKEVDRIVGLLGKEQLTDKLRTIL